MINMCDYEDASVLREVDFMSAVSILADKHNCKLIDIDFEGQVIELDGEAVDISKCIIEIEEIFYRYV